MLLTEIGRRAPSLKALATLMTGALPVARWGRPDLQHAVLPGVASGELLLTAALREPSEPAARPSGHSRSPTGQITGTKIGVPYAAEAPASSSPPASRPPASMIVAVRAIAPKTGHDHGVASS